MRDCVFEVHLSEPDGVHDGCQVLDELLIVPQLLPPLKSKRVGEGEVLKWGDFPLTQQALFFG